MPHTLIAALIVCLALTGTCFAWEFDTLETTGSAYERGVQHGKHFAEEIRKDFTVKRGWGWSVPDAHKRPEVVNHFVQRLLALPHGRELVDEMQGIAEGSGMPFTDIAALNFTFDLNDRTACSTAILPTTDDGPVLITTLDDFPGGKHRRQYPCFAQIVKPTDGHAFVMLTGFGTVWAFRGLNDAGLAIGAASGGLGRHRMGSNYNGFFYGMLTRYGLQFYEKADDVIQLFDSNRSVAKANNISVLDADGDGAIIEWSAHNIAVRRVTGDKPVYATNFFLGEVWGAYDDVHERTGYMINSRARYARFTELFGQADMMNLAFANRVIQDTNDGKEGQICQDNGAMFTTSGGVFACRSATAHLYTTYPHGATPHIIEVDDLEKPSQGAPAPPSDEVGAVLNAEPMELKLRHVKYLDATVESVEIADGYFTFTEGGQTYRGNLEGNVRLNHRITLDDISPDELVAMWGHKLADDKFEATRIVKDVPPRKWNNNGRLVGSASVGEASGLLTRQGDGIRLEYREGKFATVTLAKGCEIYAAHHVKHDALEPGQRIEMHGRNLYDGDIVRGTWLLIYADAKQAAAR